jgi:sugar O-acyltransferase (sialic acid O-acetyltransferase NeuD family)
VTSLVFLTAGGTALDVLGLIQDVNAMRPTFEMLGFLDDAPHLRGTSLNGLPVLGPLADHAKFADALFVNCLGSPANHWRRGPIVEQLGVAPDRFATIVHPSAVISRSATIDAGAVIYPFAFVGDSVRIGRQVLLMSHTSLNHDAAIGEYSIVASGAIILGKVRVGAHAYIGAGSSLHQGVSVGSRSLVGMGATVLKDVPADTVVVGTPARFLRMTGDPARGGKQTKE